MSPQVTPVLLPPQKSSVIAPVASLACCKGDNMNSQIACAFSEQAKGGSLRAQAHAPGKTDLIFNIIDDQHY